MEKRSRLGYISPSRRSHCTACGREVQLSHSTAAAGPTCQACRRARHGYGSYKRGCRCEVCRAAARVARQGARACEKCARPVLARGMCSTHYSYWYRRWVSSELSRGGSWIEPGRRLRLYERDGWQCAICGGLTDRDGDANAEQAPSLDHVVPRSQGGSDEDENLRCAHRGCNARRGAPSGTL